MGKSASDAAVQDDYDGDGKVDTAVWNNTNGNWYIRESAQGNLLRQVAWELRAMFPFPLFTKIDNLFEKTRITKQAIYLITSFD